ncbi:MAG TPA: hypothetical protein VF407_17940 [Polyangiaceae bacterium]
MQNVDMQYCVAKSHVVEPHANVPVGHAPVVDDVPLSLPVLPASEDAETPASERVVDAPESESSVPPPEDELLLHAATA